MKPIEISTLEVEEVAVAVVPWADMDLAVDVWNHVVDVYLELADLASCQLQIIVSSQIHQQSLIVFSACILPYNVYKSLHGSPTRRKIVLPANSNPTSPLGQTVAPSTLSLKKDSKFSSTLIIPTQ